MNVILTEMDINFLRTGLQLYRAQIERDFSFPEFYNFRQVTLQHIKEVEQKLQEAHQCLLRPEPTKPDVES